MKIDPEFKALIRFICPCGEVFDAKVWHCPVCDHHWLMHRDECWNCHKGRKRGAAKATRVRKGDCQ